MQCLECKILTNNPRFCSKSCSAKFNNRVKPKRKPTKNCKSCGKIINATRRYCALDCKNSFYKKRKENSLFRKKKSNNIAVVSWRNRQKVRAVEYKGGKCEICGYNKCFRSLQFHHINPKDKLFGIGSSGCTRSWAKVKNELDKCILVCSNCHGEIHDKILTGEERFELSMGDKSPTD